MWVLMTILFTGRMFLLETNIVTLLKDLFLPSTSRHIATKGSLVLLLFRHIKLSETAAEFSIENYIPIS